MPYATTKDNVKLYYEEVGSGTPIIFSHEFAGDYRNWELQMRYFSRRHRCITYSARGYKPSDIPEDANTYSYMHWVSDVVAILDHLKIAKVHFVGLSMGGYTALMMGAHQPSRLLSLTAAGAGSGSDRAGGEEFRKTFMTTADEFEKHGSAYVVERYGMGTARIPYLVKDPRGFAEFIRNFAEHSAQGSANTMLGYQGRRPSFYTLKDEMARIAAPLLIVAGDEDDPTLEPSLLMKRTIPTAGLLVLPNSGHLPNLEDPALFNRLLEDFFHEVESGRWLPRAKRS